MTHSWTYRAELLSEDGTCYACRDHVPYSDRMPARYLVIATHRSTGAEQLRRYCIDHAQGVARRRGFQLPAITGK